VDGKRVFQHGKTAFAAIVPAFFIISAVAPTLCQIPKESSYFYTLQNNSSFEFNPPVNLTDTPQQGVAYDNNLISYWRLDEGKGSVVYDSGSGENGTLYGCTWVPGKYGSAVNFDGNTSSGVTTPLISPTQPSALTLSAWVNLSASNPTAGHWIVGKSWGNSWGMYVSSTSGKVCFYGRSAATYQSAQSTRGISFGSFHHIALVYSYTDKKINFYINGVSAGSSSFNYTLDNSVTTVTIGNLALNYSNWRTFGIIDDVRIYNRTLSAAEVASLYLRGQEPDPVSFANYYRYTDSNTNNTMLIKIDCPTADNNDTALVVCTNFFAGNKLVFQANNNATVNVWTDLGQPTFITNGNWNSENYTTTLVLDASSAGELRWDPPSPPSASNLSINSTVAGSFAVFSALWSDNQSLTGGGYVFSTNNTGQWINASWIPFTTNPDWGNATLTLNSTIGTVIGFREYANNSLNLWVDSGICTITITPMTDTPTPTPSPTPTPTPTPSPTPTPTPTPTPNLPSTLTPTQTNPFPTETVVIATAVITVMIALLALAFKTGYITIEIVEENPEETSDQAIRIFS
jgi:hypothetical protein